MSFNPPSQVVHVGTLVTVEVQLGNVENVGAAEFQVSYNPAVLKYSGSEAGGFIGSTGRHTLCPAAVLRTESDVLFGCVTDSASGLPGASGTGVLATLHFQALAVGESGLQWTKVGLADASTLASSIEVSTVGTAAIQVIAAGDAVPSQPPSTPTADIRRLTPTPIATPANLGNVYRLTDPPDASAVGSTGAAGDVAGATAAPIGSIGISGGDGTGTGSDILSTSGAPGSSGAVSRAPVAGYGPQEPGGPPFRKIAWVLMALGAFSAAGGFRIRPRAAVSAK